MSSVSPTKWPVEGFLSDEYPSDVIGIVKEVSDVQELQTKVGRLIKKRELTLVDRSGYSVRMTLWGKQAEDYHEDEHAVLAFKSAKVGDFGGKVFAIMAQVI